MHGRVEDRLARGGRADGQGDLAVPGVLGQVADGPGGERLADAFVVRVGGEDHDLDLRVLGWSRRVASTPSVPGMRRSMSTTCAPLLVSQRHRLVAVGGLADDADVALVVEHHGQRFPDGPLVIGDDDPDRPRAVAGHL